MPALYTRYADTRESAHMDFLHEVIVGKRGPPEVLDGSKVYCFNNPSTRVWPPAIEVDNSVLAFDPDTGRPTRYAGCRLYR